MITFEDAREAVRASVQPNWPTGAGTFYVAPWGWEDSTAYRVEAGAREWIVDEDPLAEPMDVAVYLVDKTSREITVTRPLAVMDRLATMRRCGAPQPKA